MMQEKIKSLKMNEMLSTADISQREREMMSKCWKHLFIYPQRRGEIFSKKSCSISCAVDSLFTPVIMYLPEENS